MLVAFFYLLIVIVVLILFVLITDIPPRRAYPFWEKEMKLNKFSLFFGISFISLSLIILARFALNYINYVSEYMKIKQATGLIIELGFCFFISIFLGFIISLFTSEEYKEKNRLIKKFKENSKTFSKVRVKDKTITIFVILYLLYSIFLFSIKEPADGILKSLATFIFLYLIITFGVMRFAINMIIKRLFIRKFGYKKTGKNLFEIENARSINIEIKPVYDKFIEVFGAARRLSYFESLGLIMSLKNLNISYDEKLIEEKKEYIRNRCPLPLKIEILNFDGKISVYGSLDLQRRSIFSAFKVLDEFFVVYDTLLGLIDNLI